MIVPYKVWRQYGVPQHGLSRLAGWLANSETVWLKNYLIKSFLKRYTVNMLEAVEEDPFAYPSYNTFFTRHLKPETRPIEAHPASLVSPADATLYQCGKMDQETLLKAKNHHHTLISLLGYKDSFSQDFESGYYFCFYLAPQNYHRVHMPLAGKLLKMRYVPGRLFSVSPLTATHVPQVFARNERLVLFFEGEKGLFSVILVGAMLVGSIHTAWAGQIAPSTLRHIKEVDYAQHPLSLQKGEEVGYFSLGSTVILLFDKNHDIQSHLNEEDTALMGEAIGNF